MGQLLFLHGYGRPPSDYAGLVDGLRAAGHDVKAPFFYGNHALGAPPRTVDEGLALTLEYVERERLEDYLVVGHSTGAGMGLLLADTGHPPTGVVALCPIRAIDYTWPRFVLRSLRMNAKHWLGLSGRPLAGWGLTLRTGLAFQLRMLRNPACMTSFLEDLAAFELARAQGRAPHDLPVCVVHTRGDEFFDLGPSFEADLRSRFAEPELVLVDEPSHEWCLLDPATALELVLPRLESFAGSRAGEG